MSAQTLNITLSWHQQDAALDYAKDLERRGWDVALVPKLDGSNWRWCIGATIERAIPAPAALEEKKP